MIHLQVEREREDQLRREIWSFWYYDNRHAIVLDGYRQEERPSKRHKYQVESMYSRLRSREAKIEEADVPLPEDVVKEAIDKFNSSLRVSKWDELK